MKIIGITGGVGSGKSALLSYIKDNYNCRVILADEVAHRVKEPGQPAYQPLVSLLCAEESKERMAAELAGISRGGGPEETHFLPPPGFFGILGEDGRIDRERMARRIFASGDLLEKVNAIIHPAVKEYILREIDRARAEKKLDFLLIEAALLIENGYLEIVDEMWYIYAEEKQRRQRLKRARGYSEEKIDAIFKSQLTEEEFRKACGVVIDNSGRFEDACRQIDGRLRETPGEPPAGNAGKPPAGAL